MTERPKALKVRPEGIPPAIKAMPNWALWSYKYNAKLEKWDKPPYQGASSTNPGTWRTFDEAYELYVAFQLDGLYFALPDDRSMNGGDFDHCLNGTAIKDAQVAAWVRSQNTYTEISPGGEGLRTVGYGSKPGEECRKGTEIELYDHGRFLSITGHHYEGTPETVNDNADAIDSLYKEVFGDVIEPIEPRKLPSPAKVGTAVITKADKALLKYGRDHTPKFKQLFDTSKLTITYKKKGNKGEEQTKEYASPSEADKALVNILVYLTNGNFERSFRLARASQRLREKWDTDRGPMTWIEREITNSIADLDDGGFKDADVIQYLDDSGKVAIDLVVDDILESHRVYTFVDDSQRSDLFQMFIHDGQIYVPTGRSTIEEEAERLLKHRSTRATTREIVEKISRLTRQDRDEIDAIAPIELIPLRDKVFNRKTREFEEYHPDMPLFLRFPGMYKPELLDRLDESIAIKTLRQVFPDRVIDDRDPENIKTESDLPIVQEIGGSMLYRECLFKKSLLCLGDGDNGKSLVLWIIDLIIGKGNLAHRTLKALSDNRFASCALYHVTGNTQADIGSELIKSTGAFKAITGGDSIDAEIKHGPAWSFVPYATHVYSANALSELMRPDPVFYERFILAEMLCRFVVNPDEENPNEFPQDAFIKEKILANLDFELDCVTTWFIEGLDRVLSNGHYTETHATKNVMQRWINLTNSLKAFVDSPEVEHAPGVDIVKRRFYEAYTKWCYKGKMAPISEEYVGRLLPGMIETRTKETKPHTWTNITVKGVEPFNAEETKREYVDEVSDGQKRLGDVQ